VSAAVEPARRSLLTAVRADTERLLTEADARGAELLEQADAQGPALVAQARAEGEAAAALEGAQERGQARRSARSAVLAAQRTLQEELHRRAQEAAQELRAGPSYPALLDRLEAAAREQLGAEPTVTRDAPDSGGVLASRGDRSVDYSLDALVRRCLDGLGTKVERLWS
jgi:vacuolar-type H+-ATPase subunit E/Vma4